MTLTYPSPCLLRPSRAGVSGVHRHAWLHRIFSILKRILLSFLSADSFKLEMIKVRIIYKTWQTNLVRCQELFLGY